MQLKKLLIGNTVRITWVDSGVTATPISAAIRDGVDAVVSSAAMVSSGNGHYFADVTVPSSLGYYVAETVAVVAPNTYTNRVKFKAISCEVD